jgi:hypothetical protein
MQMVGITTTAMVTNQTQMEHLQHLKLVNSLDSQQVLNSLLHQQPLQLWVQQSQPKHGSTTFWMALKL